MRDFISDLSIPSGCSAGARLHDHRGRRAGAGDRRGDGDFFYRERGAAAAFAGVRSGPLRAGDEQFRNSKGESRRHTAAFSRWNSRYFRAAIERAGRCLRLWRRGDELHRRRRGGAIDVRAHPPISSKSWIPILRGRSFSQSEDSPHGPHVALISQELWNNRFAGDPQILGRTIR